MVVVVVVVVVGTVAGTVAGTGVFRVLERRSNKTFFVPVVSRPNFFNSAFNFFAVIFLIIAIVTLLLSFLLGDEPVVDLFLLEGILFTVAVIVANARA